ncbi:rhomboid family intramembrane serine protease [Granulicella aggregans]|uniref:rhomboid family intramembrane serine protease n=1 Tax=Granulicella aggregans TaxID=474949 RepID=UPI0021E0EF3B|nr:rhomboid family intramembrane serine protease [Granulicella aggregans]
MPEDPSTPVAVQELPTLQQTLDAATPKVMVTIALIAINLSIFVAMFILGASSFQPAQILPWGANYGPLTTHGQWWRLLTACFIHLSVIHVLMNMYILFQVGIFTEKLFGNLRFLVLYLLAGVFGNVAGLYLHPNVVSAGASGAVFGVYGALLAFLLKEPDVIPKANALAIAKSAGVFLLFNIIYGLSKSEVDMTAHIAGLAGGFVAGWFLASPLLPAAQHIQPLRALTVAAGGTLLATVCLMAAPKTQMNISELNRQVMTGKSIPVGNGGKIIYSGAATVEDAENLGKLLREQYFFSNQGNVILFSKDSTGPSITFPLRSQRAKGVSTIAGNVQAPANAVPLWDDPNTILNFERLGVLIAPFVGGPPLEVRLTDAKGDLKHVLHIEYRSRAVSAHDRVWYSGTASEADAKVLGKTLQSLGYFHDTGGLVLLKKNAGATDLSLIVKDGVWNDQRLVAGFQTLGVKIADAMGSHPLALHLLDGTHQEKKLLTVP